ncbi:unnamed protein product [Thelazia callipaeda]|uniref:SAM domain-containing protein n=1 Tax=Thelazia callipaeda TaxID=103827 RepID=A0A0N5CZQ7_THECL|nr:unnamed protein product [Thelazia callipaeda]
MLITADDEKLRDPEGYEAIALLHHQMDDDQSGSIDRSESIDFLKEDMQLSSSDRAQRERAFHNSDELITVDDLWDAWFASEERSWTNSDLVVWLENIVRLPQYKALFIAAKIDGRALPRIANSTYLNDLGIKNPVHKHKLRLKALDVVLFGFSGGNTTFLKDIALSFLMIVLITVLFVFKMQRTRSQLQMDQLTMKLSELKSMQSDFEDEQQKLEEEQKRRHSDENMSESERVKTLESQLMEAERLLESSSLAPLALQPLLRRTCELEVSYVRQQRLDCMAEMKEAIELIDKLRKKQSSIVSSIKLATGASSGTDLIDSRIFSLKNRMEKISLSVAECHQRWMEIESLCGFPLFSVPNPVVAVSIASSSSSGSAPPSLIKFSSIRPPGCSCTYDTMNSATSSNALAVDEVAGSCISCPSAVDHTSLFREELKSLKRSVSNALFKSSKNSSEKKENGMMESKGKNSINSSVNNKKSKFSSMFMK